MQNLGFDVPAVIAQRTQAGIAGEPYHYSLGGFALVFDAERAGGTTTAPRIFHRIKCELELKSLQKKFSYDITIDMPEGQQHMEVQNPFGCIPIGQPEPCTETLTVRLIDGSSELLSITAPVKFLPE